MCMKTVRNQVIHHHHHHRRGLYWRSLHSQDIHFASTLGQISPLINSYGMEGRTKRLLMCPSRISDSALSLLTLEVSFPVFSLGRVVKGVAVATETKAGKVVVMQ